MQGPSGTFALSKHTVSNVENAIGEPHVPKNRRCAAKIPQFLSFASQNNQFLSWPDHPLTPGWVSTGPLQATKQFRYPMMFLMILRSKS